MTFINESVSSLRRAGLDMKLQISDKLIRPGNALELGLKYLYINNFTKNPSIWLPNNFRRVVISGSEY